MNTSYNWLKSYIDFDESPEKISEILTDIGLEVEGLEKIESIEGGLKGLVVAEVLTCVKHPNADKLKLTTVDIGAEVPSQIVCGAPNVAAGQFVIVATPGTTLYPVDGDSFKIKKGKIRGEVSLGMICAEDEIGLGKGHDGIIVLDKKYKPGTPASVVFELENDYVFEIGLTPNRSDATCHIGVAKDLASALRVQLKKEIIVRTPETESFAIDEALNPIEVTVENSEACPRYTGVCIEGVKIGPSPEWLKTKLTAIGVKSISNVVDITNYILHEYGQPLHAFDSDKIAGKKIIVKTLPADTSFLSLDEKERKLSTEDLMICDANSNGMCIAGVFGGLHSGISDETTNLFLESAHFSPKWIRRSSTRHLLRTDAAKVFEKGSDPNVCLTALKRAAIMMRDIAGGRIVSDVIDIYPNVVVPKEINLRYKRINQVIGVEIPKSEILLILKALEMDLVEEREDGVVLKVPTNKFEVIREIDVIEEILRIYGYNNVPTSDRINASVNGIGGLDVVKLRNDLASFLVGKGYREIMGLSLTRSKYIEGGAADFKAEELIYINNTSTVELNIMRPNMIVNVLESVARNQNRQQKNLKFFEFGKSYLRNSKIEETSHLTITLTGNVYPEGWLSDQLNINGFYALKTVVLQTLELLGIDNYKETVIEEGDFNYSLSFAKGPMQLVQFGSIKKSQLDYFDIKNEVFFADFNWDNITKVMKNGNVSFSGINKYPTVRRDLALLVGKSIKFKDIVNIINKTEKKKIRSINLFDVYENVEQLGADKRSYAISIILEDTTKTLSDKEVDKIMNKIIGNIERELSVEVRK